MSETGSLGELAVFSVSRRWPPAAAQQPFRKGNYTCHNSPSVGSVGSGSHHGAKSSLMPATLFIHLKASKFPLIKPALNRQQLILHKTKSAILQPGGHRNAEDPDFPTTHQRWIPHPTMAPLVVAKPGLPVWFIREMVLCAFCRCQSRFPCGCVASPDSGHAQKTVYTVDIYRHPASCPPPLPFSHQCLK